MTKQAYQAPNNKEEAPYSFQTLNINMQDKSYQRSRTPKLLKPFFDMLKRIHWFTLLLIFILGWSGYQMMMRSPEKYQWVQEVFQQMKTAGESIQLPQPIVQKMPVKSPSVVETTPTPITTPMPSNQTATSASEIVSAVPVSNEKKWNALEQRLAHMETSVKRTNLQMAALQRNARALDNQLKRLNQSVDMLPQMTLESPRPAAAATSASASSNQATEKAPVSANNQSNTAKKSEYTLHAVIPGRAWLNTPESKIITVSVGSPLPHYGLIQAIDSDQGVVYCSTGAMIKFSTQDY